MIPRRSVVPSSANKLWLLGAVLAGSAGLVACGNKEAPPPAASAPSAAAPAPATSAPATPAPAPATSAPTASPATPAPAAATQGAAPAAAPATGKPLKVAFAYVGPVGDAGWTFAHDTARKKVEAEFGGRVKTSYVENVPESADAERVLRDLAEQGNDVIFGTTFGYMETMLKLAKEYPKIKWEHATGFKSAENMRAYDVRAYEGAYLAGIIAGKMTKTNTLGFVASIPIPEVVRNINAYTLGAQTVNPAVKTKVVWINKWFDPGKEAEAAQSLINGGADVLLQNTDSSAPLQTAEKAGKLGFGWDSDMKHFGPKAHLGSSIIDWAPYYGKAIRQVLDGTWKVEENWWGIKDGAIDLVSLSDAIPADVRKLVEEKRKAIADGSLKIWTGPMVSSDDKEILAKDATGDDKFIGSIMFYVKGVEGKVPTGK
jgi:basic membrane protein A